MITSNIAIKIYALKQMGIITSNAKFWKNFSCEDKFDEIDIDLSLYKKELEELNVNLTCCFDTAIFGLLQIKIELIKYLKAMV